MINGSQGSNPARLHISPIPRMSPSETGNHTIFEAPSGQFPFEERLPPLRPGATLLTVQCWDHTGTLYHPN